MLSQKSVEFQVDSTLLVLAERVRGAGGVPTGPTQQVLCLWVCLRDAVVSVSELEPTLPSLHNRSHLGPPRKRSAERSMISGKWPLVSLLFNNAEDLRLRSGVERAKGNIGVRADENPGD